MEVGEDIALLGEVLRDAGYATYAVDTWLLTRDSASNAALGRGTRSSAAGRAPLWRPRVRALGTSGGENPRVCRCAAKTVSVNGER